MYRLLYGNNIDVITLARNARTSQEMIDRFYASQLKGEDNILGDAPQPFASWPRFPAGPIKRIVSEVFAPCVDDPTEREEMEIFVKSWNRNIEMEIVIISLD